MSNISILSKKKKYDNKNKTETITKYKREVLNGTEYIKFSFLLPRQLHHTFKIKTCTDGTNMTEVLVEAIHQYMLTSV